MSDKISTILIVDDVPTNIHILGDTLAAEYKLHIAMSGPEALQLAMQCRPDLILLDIMMPGMDGFEVFRRLRRMEALAEVPVIFVTALEGPADESIGLQLGAADYITKPFNPELVKLRVRNHLELARQRALLKEQRDRLELQNEGLKSALERIKRLEGVIPICMCCKKIRDDQDSWHQLEYYIAERSEALFSHGLCPHCARDHMDKNLEGGSGLSERIMQVHQESEERFRLLCDSAPIGIFMADSKGRNIYSNPRLEEICGQAAPENPEQGWDMPIHPEDRAEALRFWQELIATGRPDSHEPRLQTPKGETQRIRTLVNPIKDQDGQVTGYVGTVEDITSLAQAREEMIKIQKLESVGLLAGGIAHDFNNILTGILGNISLAQIFVEPSSKAQGPLKEMEKASERAAALTRQLLTFAKGGDPVKKAVSVNHLVSEAVSIALRGSNVQGVIAISDSVHAVEVDEGQMLQALSNIVINGAQAMPEGGKLTVEAHNARLGRANRLGLPAGEYVKVSISDEGSGIPEGHLGKIFDPYFTTKPNSTGLGLASTYSILAKHGGHVGAHSQPGAGATFTLHLPSCGKRSAEIGAEIGASDAEHHQGGAILVMDDDQMIRTIATQMLECLGYQVSVCDNGTEAISLYRSAQDAGTPFEAVIMDLTIAGGMGGAEAAQHILAIDPEARLIVSSGYNNDRVMADYRKYGFCSVIPKPYRTSDLSAVLSGIFSKKVG